MNSIRKLLSALFLALCFSAYSNAQVSTSGELINNGSWSGAVYGADPGGCCASISGSGPLYDTTTDTILFSYGQSTISQNIGLEAALGAQGIVLHGYNYSWDYRLVPNGNNFTSDNLIFNTRIRDASGNILFDRTSDYSGPVAVGINDAWQTQSGTVTFEPMYGASTLSLSITGRDGGFWAGYYGPEVRNVSMSVNYTVDPCVNDPLYSSSCAGYWDAFVAAFGAFFFGSPEPEASSIEYTIASAPVTLSAMPEETTTGEVKVDAGGIEVSTTGELSVPDGIPEEVKEKKPIDMNLISKIVREATDDSKALAIVNQSIEQSMEENANPDFSMTNETLASIDRQREFSVQQSILENQEAAQSSITIIPNEQSVSYDVTNMTQNITQDENATSELQNENKVETSELQNQSLPKVTNEDKKENTQTVKKEVQDNEAAGEVSIDDLANSPIDFNAYLNQQMKDMAFYLPKEIYKGQKNVDNARLLRGLTGGSDRLHQEMVNQQYGQ